MITTTSHIRPSVKLKISPVLPARKIIDTQSHTQRRNTTTYRISLQQLIWRNFVRRRCGGGCGVGISTSPIFISLASQRQRSARRWRRSKIEEMYKSSLDFVSAAVKRNHPRMRQRGSHSSRALNTSARSVNADFLVLCRCRYGNGRQFEFHEFHSFYSFCF